MEQKTANISRFPQPGEADDQGLVHPPLVTVVITNFNYRDYVRDAIRSVVNQSYPNVEIIVVDDVSTDDSVEVISNELRGLRSASLYRRVYNGGQGAAIMDGLRNAHGEFICFLDADDVLLPHFCATHVHLHLALPQQIAFSSSDLVHITKAGRVSSGSSGNIRYAFQDAGPSEFISLPKVSIAPEIDRLCRENPLPDRVVYLPSTKVGYHWASCSGLLFKRAALELIAFDEALGPTRLSADFYITLVHLICGSAIIDAKLGGYRIHGKNGYSSETHLDGIDTSRRTTSAFYQDIFRRFIRLMITTEFNHFWSLLGKSWRYHEVLRHLQTYISHFNRDQLNSKLIEDEILQDWETFARQVGYDHALWIAADILKIAPQELRDRGIL